MRAAGLHLACANGHMKMVELLLGFRANVNAADRWGGTPLEDAVTSGHVPVANLLRSKGAAMRPGSGASKFCDAAARGNVVALRMLHGCRVAALDGADYDGRTALMVAAAEGRLLAVSFLLSCSCAPNLLDRWGATALDDALRGGTLYHVYCARLIQSWGGRSAALAAGTEEGDEALRRLEGVDIDEVRRTLRRLIERGYDQRVPSAPTDHELRLAFETCVAHVPLIASIRRRVQDACALGAEAAAGLEAAVQRLVAAARPLCGLLDRHPFLRRRRRRGAARRVGTLLERLDALDARGQREAAPDAAAGAVAAGRRAQTLQRMLSRLMKEAAADGVVDDEEYAQITGAWGELEEAEREARLHGSGGPDSDEEDALWAETDRLMGEREFCEEHGLNRSLFQAAMFRSAAARLGELEGTYAALCRLYLAAQRPSQPGGAPAGTDTGTQEGEPRVTRGGLAALLALIDRSRPDSQTPAYEIEEMFAEACGRDSRTVGGGGGGGGGSGSVAMWQLVARSAGFREALLDAEVDEVRCLLLRWSRMGGDAVPEPILRDLADGGCLQTVHRGEVLLRQPVGDGGAGVGGTAGGGAVWFVVVVGSFSVETEGGSEFGGSQDDGCILGPGSCFGGAATLVAAATTARQGKSIGPAPACVIRARSGGRLLRLPLRPLERLRETHPSAADWLAKEMGEAQTLGPVAQSGGDRDDLVEMDTSLHSSLSISMHGAARGDRALRSAGSFQVRDRAPAGPVPGSGRSMPELKCGPGHTFPAVQPSGALGRTGSSDAHFRSFRQPFLDAPGSQALERVGSFGSRSTRGQGEALTPASPVRNISFLPSFRVGAVRSFGDAAESGDGSDLMSELYIVRSGLKCINETWQALSSGLPAISRQELLSLREVVGEIGSGTFAKLFPAPAGGSGPAGDINADLKDVSENEFWALWLRLLADKTLDSCGRASRCSIAEDDIKNIMVEAARDSDGHLQSWDPAHQDAALSWAADVLWGQEADPASGIDLSFSESVRGFFSPSRKLAMKFLDEELFRSGRYEEVWLRVVGDLNSTLQRKDLPLFLRLLFPGHVFNISSYNCQEFLSVFGRGFRGSQSLSWADLKKVLRSKSSEVNQKLLVDGVLNPESRHVGLISILQHALAVFHLASCPVRLCFEEQADEMLEPVSFCIFIVADALTFAYVCIRFNMAYRSTRRNALITNRWRIAKKVSNMFIVPALPLDWIALGIGAADETCLWFRVTKLLFTYQTHKERGGLFKSRSRPVTLILWSVAVMHICACFWYYIGQKQKYVDPSKPFSWFKVGYPLDDPRYKVDSPYDGNGYEYHGLSCNETLTATCSPGDSWYYFGMRYDDPWIARYLLSFYYSCTRVADQSLTGNIVPQNFMEVCYCIGFLLLNLTAYRYVIGELSAWVIGLDEDKVEAQARAMKVLDFISHSKLSKDVELEIKAYIKNSGISQSSVARCTRVLRLLPHSLQVEIARHVCGGVLDGIELFKGCSDRFKDFLSVSMSTVAFSPEEYIFRLGEVATDMYIVHSGSVEELMEAQNTVSGQKVSSVVRPGQPLGELAFFFELRCAMAARASRSGGAICLKLGRDRFVQLLKYCPEEEDRITENAMRCFEVIKRTGQSVMSFGASSERHVASTDDMDWSSYSKQITSVKSLSEDDDDSNLDEGPGPGRKVRQTIMQLKHRRKLLRTHMLLTAAKSNNLAGIEWALEGEHITLNCCDDLGRTALHVAASEGNAQVVQSLLQASVDPGLKDCMGNTALNDAVRHHHDATATIIRGFAPDQCVSLPGCRAGIHMCEAAASGNLTEIKRLVANGVPVQACDYDRRFDRTRSPFS